MRPESVQRLSTCAKTALLALFGSCAAWRTAAVPAAPRAAADPAGPTGAVHILFIGNSFTFRNNLPDLVRRMAATGNPARPVKVTAVTYGGRTLKDHWTYRSQDWVRLPALTGDELKRAIDELRTEAEAHPTDTFYGRSIRRHEKLRGQLNAKHPAWDYVVLQSWRDTAGGLDSAYAEYARRFAELAKRGGARVVLYDTAPEFQNAKPLTGAPPDGPALERARVMARLAASLDARVVPMPLVARRCQAARPDVTLRYVKDSHPNQTMAYLTAATFYAVLFGQSPEGLPVNEVTDTKVTDREHPELDPDGGPQRKVLDDDLRAALQRIVAQALDEFRRMAAE
ncbi:MAG: hypothetical protein JXR37_23495 [Kiritimatiellae bacterium]|nr:hypothetical protein [Kiritimatiellia bacterium]